MADIFNMADTWNDGATTFAAIKMNVTDTASATASLLLDLQTGGTSRGSLRKDGSFWAATHVTGTSHTSRNIELGAGGLHLGNAQIVSWAPNTAYAAAGDLINVADLALARDAANTLAQRRATAAQTFNIYNTWTDASNYERLNINWASNIVAIRPQAAGTGTLRVLHISGLPTANPGPGILWNNAGTPAIGT